MQFVSQKTYPPQQPFSPASPAASPATSPTESAQPQSQISSRILNTAVLSSKSAAQVDHDYVKELSKLMETPAYKAMLTAVKAFSLSSGLSEKDAAEQMIQTFRSLDSLWQDYAFQQGLDRIKSLR